LYMNKFSASMLVAGVAILAACNNTGTNTGSSDTAAPVRTQFLDPSAIDSSVKPGDNFWLYANGRWDKTAQIPATESSVGSFTDLAKANRQALQQLCENAAASNAEKGTVAQKVGDFYKSGMDTATIDKLGYQPVQAELNAINSLQDGKGVMQWVAKQYASGNAYLYSFGVVPDEKNAARMIPAFYQGGLGLPDRDYYFKTDPQSKELLAQYAAYIKKLFTLTGEDSTTAATNAAAVIATETEIAKGHLTNEELRDPEKNYNKLSQADMAKLAPAIDWKATFDALGMKQDSFVVGQTKFYQNLGTIITKTPIASWKQYLRFNVLSDAAPYLSSAFEAAQFGFYSTTLRGQQQQRTRAEHIATLTDAYLGEALGQLYVKKYFKDEARRRMDTLINNLQQVYKKRIQNLDWMSDSTKQIAIGKLEAFTKKIGFPDKWKDYNVEIKPNDFIGNLNRLGKWQYEDMIAKQGQPVDRSRWEMTPPTINAYYNPPYNEIVFPAGILQFPFFDPNADDAINYGGIGMVIGHEMTHGFDDQGAQYDKDGNLKNWWGAADKQKFTGKVKQVIDQYDRYTVLPDSLHVKGALTVGENLADIGGLAIAYEAFKNTRQGQGNEKKDGFTPDQRFFLSFAQIWRVKVKDESLRRQIQGNPHSPAMWRVNGPVSNFTPWYTAFGVKQGDKLWKPESERIKVW
jgi:putative endopeptidase